METTEKILKLAAENRQQAFRVIEQSNVIGCWQSVGARINLIGSLKTGLLMKHRDIDFHVYTPRLNVAESFRAMTRLAENPRIVKTEYVNLTAEEDACLEWHAWYQSDDGNTWQIDMIHMAEGCRWDGYFEKFADRINANARDEAAAAVEAAKSAGRYEKNQLEYTKIYAPADGIVSSRIQEPGATVSAGQPVYTVTKTEPLWIRVYLPEPKLGRVDYGSKAVIVTDGIDPATGERKHYRGHVGYISPVAEFTPKTVQTEELRTDLVYRLNIYVDDADRFLKQGMPTTVKIYAEHAEKSDDGEKLH